MENQEYKQMIDRYFRGQLADEEYNELTEYLQDSEHLKLFDEQKRQWEENPEAAPVSTGNWLRLQPKINRQKSTSAGKTISRRLWIKVASAAALLAVGLFLGHIVSLYLPGTGLYREPMVFETPRGEKSMVKLPDGSQVWLNANSKLICHSFTSRSRDVELSGEAFFRVTHNKKSPFRVKTDECEVEVLGTEFNVMAYKNFGYKEITLLSGKVDVRVKNAQKVLTPGEALTIKGNKVWVSETNASRSSAWVDNKFDFQNISLSELVKRLENWYDVDIELDNPLNKDVTFSGTFKNEETIWQVLDAIQVYLPVSYEKTDLRKIKIKVK